MFGENFVPGMTMPGSDLYSGAGYGSDQDADIATLFKAMQAQQGITDIANLQNTGALQTQSMEGQLALLTAQERHLTLWRDIPKGIAYSTLEEYSVQLGYGNEANWAQQMESALESDPLLKRKFADTKFLRTMWKVSDVATIVSTIKDSEVIAKQSAIMRLLRRINSSLYSGDSTFISESIDGFEKTIVNNGSSDHVVDLRGVAPTQQKFRQLAELIYDNQGNPHGAGLYCSPGGMTTIDQILDLVGTSTSQRFLQGSVGPNGEMSLGSGIKKIHTSFGTIIPKTDLFLATNYEAKTIPKIPDPSDPELVIEGPTSARSPLTPTLTVAINAPTVTNSLWSASGVRVAGTHGYRVAAGNRWGLSTACAEVSAAVAASGALTLTITPQPSQFPATYFEIYGENVAGNDVFVFVTRIAASGAAAVTFQDLNYYIPGTTRMFLLDLTTTGEYRNVSWAQLAPVHSQDLAKLGPYRWGLVNLYGAMKYYAPKRFAMLLNVPVGVSGANQNIIQ